MMASERIQRLHSQGGYTLVDLLTTVAIFAAVAAAGLPHIDTRRQNIQDATSQVIGDYRWARARAITSGVHFALEWTSDASYDVQRLKQVGTTWELDEVVKTVALPPTVNRSGWPDFVEFNTRGMMISSETMEQQRLSDAEFGTERMIAVWPSGQVTEYVY
jgi:Tfp pilus assembly protein FimT